MNVHHLFELIRFRSPFYWYDQIMESFHTIRMVLSCDFIWRRLWTLLNRNIWKETKLGTSALWCKLCTCTVQRARRWRAKKRNWRFCYVRALWDRFYRSNCIQIWPIHLVNVLIFMIRISQFAAHDSHLVIRVQRLDWRAHEGASSTLPMATIRQQNCLQLNIATKWCLKSFSEAALEVLQLLKVLVGRR